MQAGEQRFRIGGDVMKQHQAFCSHCGQSTSLLSYVERKQRAAEAKQRIAKGEAAKALAREYGVTPRTVRLWAGGVRNALGGMSA